MPRYAIVDAPSNLGLRPTGVELLPDALKGAGLQTKLNAPYVGRVEPLSYSAERDPETHVLNPHGIRQYSIQLADVVERALKDDYFPIVLGGDCSILIGNTLALHRLGHYSLFFIDGHADFYQPEASPTGEVADMDLAIVSGRGPELLTHIAGSSPLVRDEDIVLFAHRDAQEAAVEGSQNVRDSGIHVYDLATVQKQGAAQTASTVLNYLLKPDLDGFWIHLDADVLDDRIMPAVDYRQAGGLSYAELTDVLKILISSGRAVGMDITIFNPTLDSLGSIARQFTQAIVAGLT